MITPYKSREIDYSTPVKIYRNLNKKGKVYSIQQNGLVVGHIIVDLYPAKIAHQYIKQIGFIFQ